MRACAAGTEPTAAMRGFVGWASYPLKCPPAPPPRPLRPPPPPPPPPVQYGFRWATTHSDGMVLQAAPQHSIVWGFADAATTAVRVCIGGGACVDAALEPGPPGSSAQVFTATLPQMPPSAAAHSITATPTPGGAAPIVLSDVVFGDVYVCSGQSNSTRSNPL